MMYYEDEEVRSILSYIRQTIDREIGESDKTDVEFNVTETSFGFTLSGKLREEFHAAVERRLKAKEDEDSRKRLG